MLRRACRVSLDFATATKRREIDRLLEAYRGAVNFYVRSLWLVSRTARQADAGTAAGRTHPPAVDAKGSGAAPSPDDCVLHAPIGEGAGRRSATPAFFRYGRALPCGNH